MKEKAEPIRKEITELYGDRSNYTGQDLELEILLAEKEGNIPELDDINSKLEDMETLLILPDKIRPDHIYLDVTFTDYKSLRNAYKAVSKCRELLGIDTSDVRKGAPESIDYLRALMCARGEERGLSRKEMAEILDFKIYYGDNPSGSYPLLQKYLKVGRWILHRLNKLEEYIHEVTGIEPNTL